MDDNLASTSASDEKYFQDTSTRQKNGLVRMFYSAVFLATSRALEESTGHPDFVMDSSTTLEFNARRNQVHDLYITLMDRLAALSTADLEPGERQNALSFLGEMSDADGDSFLDAFERVYYTKSRRISDRAKASALRFPPTPVRIKNRAKLISLLIGRLNSESPSESSAAAVGLSELADSFSIPALNAAKERVRWRSVQKDLDATISELNERT